tara:strand:+ start:919 stop:1185 length:267 start_codon:yes stop_codon:yes gene_type:complete
MNNLLVKLKKEGLVYSLSVTVGKTSIIREKEYVINDLLSEQLKIMQMLEEKIKENCPDNCALLNQQLSHVLPVSIMNELRRIRKQGYN